MTIPKHSQRLPSACSVPLSPGGQGRLRPPLVKQIKALGPSRPQAPCGPLRALHHPGPEPGLATVQAAMGSGPHGEVVTGDET